MTPRAWAGAFVAAAALGLLGLALLAPRPNEPEAPAICRAATPEPARPLACLDGRAPSVLTAELAGTRKVWTCQLYRAEAELPRADQARCAELRSRGLRGELRRFDAGFFIPLYTTVSLLSAGWLLALSSHGGAGPRLRLLAAALVLATATLAALDGRENRAALAVLDAMDAWGVAAASGAAADDAAIDTLAARARDRSVQKWAASVPWAALIGLALGIGLRGLWAPPAPRGWRWTAGGLTLVAWLGAALLATGTVMAWGNLDLAEPVRLIGAGMGLTLFALVGGALTTAAALCASQGARQP